MLYCHIRFPHATLLVAFPISVGAGNNPMILSCCYSFFHPLDRIFI